MNRQQQGHRRSHRRRTVDGDTDGTFVVDLAWISREITAAASADLAKMTRPDVTLSSQAHKHTNTADEEKKEKP